MDNFNCIKDDILMIRVSDDSEKETLKNLIKVKAKLKEPKI
jgi:hypothetical protein